MFNHNKLQPKIEDANIDHGHGSRDRERRGGPAPQDGGNAEGSRSRVSVPLSKAHIRPSVPCVEYVKGASLIRTTKGKACPAVGGGKRGKIAGFSVQSRRRLMETIACVRRDVELPNFVTLTYPANFPTVEKAKRDLKVFLQRLNRKFPQAGYIWKLEPQERGAPHFHMLVWGVYTNDLFFWVVEAWHEIAGDGDPNHYKFHLGALRDSKPCVQQVRSWRGVWAYAAKYLGKTFEVAQWGSTWTGRFWGVGNRANIPFGERVVIEITEKEVVQTMRLQRRFMRQRKSRDLNSLKTFCDADQWIERSWPEQIMRGGAAPQSGGVPLFLRPVQLPARNLGFG